MKTKWCVELSYRVVTFLVAGWFVIFYPCCISLYIPRPVSWLNSVLIKRNMNIPPQLWGWTDEIISHICKMARPLWREIVFNLPLMCTCYGYYINQMCDEAYENEVYGLCCLFLKHLSHFILWWMVVFTKIWAKYKHVKFRSCATVVPLFSELIMGKIKVKLHHSMQKQNITCIGYLWDYY